MSTDDLPNVPGQGRTAGRRTLAATLVTAVVPVLLPGILVRAGLAHVAWCLLAAFAPAAATLVLVKATAPKQLQLRGGLLTARTLFGRRTVDLDRLVRVGHLVVPALSVASMRDRLLLTDAHGVRLSVEQPVDGAGPDVDAAVARRVLSPAGGVRVSHGAKIRLRPSEYGPRTGVRAVARVLVLALLLAVVVGGTPIVLLVLSLSLAGQM